jgi:crotonobetainyl-CoA:carnitine CoA-transferase CaiB-like acyl-CoA transferase
LSDALADVRVIELSSERGALAGKLLADMGAEVIVVEPPGGDRMRGYGPFLDDQPGPERSLYWWYYHTSKLGVTLDLDREADRDRFRALVASADVLLESEPPGRLQALGLDYENLCASREDLIAASITPFGSDDPRSAEPCIDLTVLAGGGPVWNCGYDDHGVAPVRGGGNQGFHTASHYAAMSILVALLARDETGLGQSIDVNMHAAANVTTEAGSYEWLVAGRTVERQTGRHAAPTPTLPTQIACADGRHVNTGVPPTRPPHFRSLHAWMVDLELIDAFPEAFLLEMGAELESIDLSKIAEDPELTAIFGAGREAQNLIASRLPAYEFFIGSQERGLPVGIIYAPEEVIEDPHFVARGFPTEVLHPELDRTFVYPGAPYRFERSPWQIQRRAPLLGEHNEAIFAALAAQEDSP